MENSAIWTHTHIHTYSRMYVCFVKLLQKMTYRVKTHDLPLQVIGTALSTRHYCKIFIISFISKNHQTWGFHLLVPHKRNLHTEINLLAVTPKTLSQPGIQLCVASIAVQLGKQTFMGYMRHFLSLFNIHVSSEHRSYYDSPEMRKYSSYIMVQWTRHPASKCVSV